MDVEDRWEEGFWAYGNFNGPSRISSGKHEFPVFERFCGSAVKISDNQ